MKDQVKIVIISHNFQEHYAIGFANAIARSGFLVDFVYGKDMDSSYLDQTIRSIDLGQNPEIKQSEGKRSFTFNLWRRLIGFIMYHLRLVRYVIAHKDSIIHVIGLLHHELVSGIFEGWLFRIAGKKYILTVHDLLPHDQHSKLNIVLYRLIYRIPHYLVVHTEKMKTELIGSFNIEDKKIIVMQHGLNDIVPDHNKEKCECREILNIPKDKCVLLFFGRIVRYKGVDILLEAFELLDERFVLLIVGMANDPGYGEEIKQRIDHNARRNSIFLHSGWVENDVVATYFRAADTLIIPYKHIDQSGLVFLALRFGLPIIAFNVGALKEYIKNGVGLVINGNNAKDLSAAIISFYDYRQMFCQEAIHEYGKQFHWLNVLIPLLTVYSK